MRYEDETKTERMVVYVGPSLLRAIDKLAEEDRRDRSEWARMVLEEKVEESSE